MNEFDLFPNDPNEWKDDDSDGIPDNQDLDDDNDGVYDISVNWEDNYIVQDLFPNDPNESSDFDRDGVGDNADTDDDNDGFADDVDAFPNNPLEWLDTDGDSIGNNSDPDIDNDGYSNFDEEFFGSDPLDSSSFPPDLDSDFVPDAIDADIDGDNVPNEFDNAPLLYNPNQNFNKGDENFIIPEIPKFFTPNGDGINDVWILEEIQRYPANKVWIYDSYGNLILYANPYQNDWDGTLNNSPLPQGSYLYMIDLNGDGEMEYEDWIYITR
jgi:gliding motility-associated-like protein